MPKVSEESRRKRTGQTATRGSAAVGMPADVGTRHLQTLLRLWASPHVMQVSKTARAIASDGVSVAFGVSAHDKRKRPQALSPWP